MNRFQYLNPLDLFRNIGLNLRFKGNLSQRKLILVSANTQIKIAPTAQIQLEEQAKLNFGFYEHTFSNTEKARLILEENSRLVIQGGDCTVQSGSTVFVGPNAQIILGRNVSLVAATRLLAYSSISIGDQCIIGWETQIMDGDGHFIFKDGNTVNQPRPIHIGNRVWIGARATILKGVTVGDGAIVATNSVVTKDVPARCIVAGNPARVVAQNIDWQP